MLTKYLDNLSLVKKSPNAKMFGDLYAKIEEYVKGDISSKELYDFAVCSAKQNYKEDNENGKNSAVKIDEKAYIESSLKVVRRVINLIINFDNKDETKYYIPLPGDMFFNNLQPHMITAGKVEYIDESSESVTVLGPNIAKRYQPGITHAWSLGVEIKGDFSKYPNGVMLFPSDWFKIISKYPKILKRMYNLARTDYEFASKYKDKSFEEVKPEYLEQLKKRSDKTLDKNICFDGKNEAEYLPQELIDSIEFVVENEHLTQEEVNSGNFLSFEELLIRSGLANKAINVGV